MKDLPAAPGSWKNPSTILVAAFLPGALAGTQIAGLLFFLNPHLPFGFVPVLRGVAFFSLLLGAVSVAVLSPMTWANPERARRLLPWSLTFVLAAAGLLEGRKVTTFPGDQDRFAEDFPSLDLVRGVSYVHDGPFLTSEGGAKSFDPAMHLVDHLYGEKVAKGVGRGLIIDWPPPSDFSALIVDAASD